MAAGLIYLYWDRFELAETLVLRNVAILFHSVALGLCLLPMTATLYDAGTVSKRPINDWWRSWAALVCAVFVSEPG